jgi:hypothetical protein
MSWLVAPPRQVARREIGRSLRFIGLLVEDLVGHSVSQGCSAGT